MIEQWKIIAEFPDYEISNTGRVYNRSRDTIMRTSHTRDGHVKITLKDGWSSSRHTRSVARLVAEAFVDPPDIPHRTMSCNEVIILDGNFANVCADNLAWRPRWFAWKYTRQLKTPQPEHYKNLAVCNIKTGFEYDSIIEAGMTEGLLFDNVWRSTYTYEAIFPTWSVFEVCEARV